jgi:membrane associated rhomboid family serine protease
MNSMNPIRRPFAYRYYNATLALIIINVAVFLINHMSPITFSYLALTPRVVVGRGYFWQVLTYMFVHGGYWHILLNMLILFIFGVQLERRMGSNEFLLFYLLTGMGVGFVYLVLGMNVMLVGASGAIYAVMLAFATYFPHSRIMVFFFLPMRAPVAVALFAGISLFFHLTGAGGGIAHLAHLVGIGMGYLYFVVRLGINPIREFLER